MTRQKMDIGKLFAALTMIYAVRGYELTFNVERKKDNEDFSKSKAPQSDCPAH